MNWRIRMFVKDASQKVWMWLAWHLPRPLAYWASVRLAANATTGQYADRHPDSVSVIDAMNAWEV